MSIYVKCNFCIECKKLEISERGGLSGICQRSGELKRWFDLGRCVGRSRRSRGEIEKLLSRFVERSTSPNGWVSGIYSPDIDAYVPISKDGFVGYHVVGKKRSSRSRSRSGGE